MKNALKEAMRQITYRLGYHNFQHLPLLLETRLRKTNEMVIVQIGANDGKSFDPIHDFVLRHRRRVRALMLEPVAEYYEELCRTYADIPTVTPLRLAVHETESSMEIFRVDPHRLAEAPPYARGIASFNRDHHLRSGTPSEWMVSERVECLPLRDVLSKHGITKLDLLCIDAEGYDAEIIDAVDFETIRPVILVFEHGLRHGVMRGEVFARIVARLNDRNYDVMVQDYDVVAHQRGRLAF